MKNKNIPDNNFVQDYFNKEHSDFNASYTDSNNLKDIIRRLSYVFNKRAIKGRFKSLLYLVGDPKGHTILEVGTGPGFYAIELSKKGGDVTGLDFSNGMLENARENARNSNVDIEFLEGDILDIKIEKTFDIIFATGVIEYISKENQLNFIKRMVELSNETVIISFPKRYVIHALLRTIWLSFFKKIKVNYFTNSNIQKLSQECKLIEIERKDVGILWVIKFKKIL
jgi:ubiquinone/menaquinone biosynthesis C-methylase UbiE